MKIFTKREIILYILMLSIAIFFCKSFDYDLSSLNDALFHYDKNYFSTIFSFIPYFILIFFSSKNIYDKLMEFNLRYSNRKIYFRKCLFDLAIIDFLYTFILLIIYILIFRFKFKFIYVDLFFKLSLQLYIVILCCLILSLLIRNYSYSFLINCFIYIYSLLFFRKKYIPFISLYITDKNVPFLLVYFVLIIVLYRIYLHIDLGGRLNEDCS